MLIHGSCHCANLTFELTWEPDPAEIPARACDCTFCRKHGGVWTSNPAASLEVFVARVRRKVGAPIIETVRGLGYRAAGAPVPAEDT